MVFKRINCFGKGINYTLLAKACKVVVSCDTKEQLKVAERYCYLAYDGYFASEQVLQKLISEQRERIDNGHIRQSN